MANKPLEHYAYNTDMLKEGQRFKNFKSLVMAVTGREPPQGGKNLDIVKHKLALHLEYIKETELDPLAPKQALIITKIHNPPLPDKENRGRSGKYSDFLKPLIMMQRQFAGKQTVLWNQWGLFGKYFDSLRDTPEFLQKIKYADQFEFNPWDTNKVLFAGECEYKRKLVFTQKQALERALNSLQKEGLLKWNHYYRIMPDILIEIDGRSEKRQRTKSEAAAAYKLREEFLSDILENENAIIQPELINALNIYSAKWKNAQGKRNYFDAVAMNDMNVLPLCASETQEKAIENYLLFLRQHTYKIYHKEKQYLKIEDLPNAMEFFGNRGLHRMYISLNKQLMPLLLNRTSIWKEIKFELTPQGKRCSKYAGNFQAQDCSEALTIEFIKYMDEHLQKFEFTMDRYSINDYKTAFGKASISSNYSLVKSESTLSLHQKLKALYNM